MKEREVSGYGCKIILDKSEQVVFVDAPTPISWQGEVNEANEIHAKLNLAQSDGFTSAAALLMKAKQFDDGLYAAVELLAQNGSGNFKGKKYLLQKLLSELAVPASTDFKAAKILYAAARLGGLDVTVPAQLEQAVTELISDFFANEAKSKPISFYTWQEQLSAIFRQDRMLQTPLHKSPGLDEIVDKLRADPELRRAYIEIVDLASKMTNPFTAKSLAPYVISSEQEYPSDDVSFFPPSVSPETDLLKKLFPGNTPIPEGFSLMEELIKRVKKGQLSLQPGANSGWYDYALWAIEPLVLTTAGEEGKRRRLSPTYKERLLELFRGAYCLTRETHVKQLDVPMSGCAAMPPRKLPPPPIVVVPECSVEPLPSVYLRRAQGYKFINDVLLASFATENLANARRLTKNGPVQMDLLQELKKIQEIFQGAHALSCDELGIDAQCLDSFDNSACISTFREWASDLSGDQDLCQDARCMVPVFFDRERGLKVWVFLGWRQVKIRVSYNDKPKIKSMDVTGLIVPKEYEPWPDGKPELLFLDRTLTAAYPAMAEIYVRSPMTRDEFVQHCEKYKTDIAILDALQEAAVS